jgi:3-phosphoshikimate 1-carboxyvinyltransferase
LHGADMQTYRDHRMAMSLALIGLRVPSVRILDPRCTEKTYPHFFEDMGTLIGQVPSYE